MTEPNQTTSKSPREPSKPAPDAPSEDKRKKLRTAYDMAKSYRDDVTASGTKRKPRIPIPVLRAFSDANLTFDQGVGLVNASRHHFRTASARARVVLEGDTVLPKRKTTPIGLYSAPLPETNPTQPETIPTMNATQEQTQQTKRKNSLRGEAMREHINALIREYVQCHGRVPTKNWLQTTHGIGYETAIRHWPSSSALEAMNQPGQGGGTEAQPAPREAVSKHELAQVIAELVYGDELVAGTYRDDGGLHHCDVINVDGSAYQPLIRKWRQHEAEVGEILRLANELA